MNPDPPTPEQRRALVEAAAVLCVIFVFVLLSASLWLSVLPTTGKLLAQAGVVVVCTIALATILRGKP